MVMPNPHWNLLFLWLRKVQRASDRGRGCSFFSSVAPTTQLLSIEPTERVKNVYPIHLNQTFCTKQGIWGVFSLEYQATLFGITQMFRKKTECCSMNYTFVNKNRL